MKIGDRVYYISGDHGQSRSNPLRGTKFECQGSISELDDDYDWWVIWDNDKTNCYYEADLEVIRRPKIKYDWGKRWKKCIAAIK